MRAKIVATLALMVHMISAWSINGHLFGKIAPLFSIIAASNLNFTFSLVANIAQDVLESQAPDSLSAANEMLKTLTEYNSTWTTHEDDHSFVECSTFADDWKYHGEAW